MTGPPAPGGIYDRFRRKLDLDRPFLLASAIAFNVLLTTIPLLLLAMAALGVAVEGSAPTRGRVVEGVLRLVPLRSQPVEELVLTLMEDRGWIGTIGVLALLWTGTRLFTSLREVLEIVFEVPPERRLGTLQGKLHDARMVLLVGALFLLTVGLTSVLYGIQERGIQAFGLSAYEVGWLTATLGWLVALVLTVAMFYFAYRYVPDRAIPRFDAALAALFAGVLFELAKHAFVLYLSSAFGRLTFLYDSLAHVVALALWIYYSSLVFVVGAELASAHRRSREMFDERQRMMADPK